MNYQGERKMPIKICPHCQQRYTVGFDTCDFEHQCNSGNPAIDNEDVVIIGDWDDGGGVTGTRPAQAVMRAGMENRLQGTRAGLEGEDDGDKTRRGARASTHRQRAYTEFINIKKEGLD